MDFKYSNSKQWTSRGHILLFILFEDEAGAMWFRHCEESTVWKPWCRTSSFNRFLKRIDLTIITKSINNEMEKMHKLKGLHISFTLQSLKYMDPLTSFYWNSLRISAWQILDIRMKPTVWHSDIQKGPWRVLKACKSLPLKWRHAWLKDKCLIYILLNQNGHLAIFDKSL